MYAICYAFSFQFEILYVEKSLFMTIFFLTTYLISILVDIADSVCILYYGVFLNSTICV